jgi:hypothetical protein
MKTLIKILGVTSLGVAIVFSAVFCCCVETTAQPAASVSCCAQGVEGSHSHSPAPQKSTDECGCSHILGLSTNRSFERAVIPSVDFHFSLSALPLAHWMDDLSIKNPLSENSPPGTGKDLVPLYLKHSALRL